MGQTVEIMRTEEFQSKLLLVCKLDTSADPWGWTPENPLWGHCAVASVLAQDFFGGELVRYSLETVKGYEYLKSHYANLLPNGEIVDFTISQYPKNIVEGLAYELRTRERVLSYPDTLRRYELLKSRFNSL